jgi:hypothetical protein
MTPHKWIRLAAGVLCAWALFDDNPDDPVIRLALAGGLVFVAWDVFTSWSGR